MIGQSEVGEHEVYALHVHEQLHGSTHRCRLVHLKSLSAQPCLWHCAESDVVFYNQYMSHSISLSFSICCFVNLSSSCSLGGAVVSSGGALETSAPPECIP